MGDDSGEEEGDVSMKDEDEPLADERKGDVSDGKLWLIDTRTEPDTLNRCLETNGWSASRYAAEGKGVQS